MKKTIVCLKCGTKLKPFSRSSEGGVFLLKMKCKNPKCKAIFSMKGKSYASVMSRVLPVQEAMRRQKIDARRRKVDAPKEKATEA